MPYQIIKRLIDITFALVLLILFLPIWLIIPVLIKLDSEGPVFYLQERLGRKGKKFNIVKFRTMSMIKVKGKTVHAAEYWKYNGDKELYKKYKESGWKLTLDEDPRVTRLGKILRQTSIDEFPQVFNILKGDMSLVGPRPIREIEIEDAVKRFGKNIQKLIKASLDVKPGLTGPWQVSGRNNISWDQRIQIDVNYAKRRSLLDDLSIMIKTPFAMLSKW